MEQGCVLTPRERRTVALYSDHSAAAIGSRFGVSATAIRMRISRARRKCPAYPRHARAGAFRCLGNLHL